MAVSGRKQSCCKGVDRLDSLTCERSVGHSVVSSRRGVEVVSSPVRDLEVIVDVPQERRLHF
jgi:hypothetical protein